MKSKSQERARKNRINLFELRRGVFHLFGGVLLIWAALYIVHIQQFLLFLLAIGVVLMFITREKFVPLISHGLNLLERKENKKYPGLNLIFYLLATIIVIQFFPRYIALASIAVLAAGDPVAGFVGRNFGRIKIFGNKTLEGTLAGLIAATLFAGLFVSFYVAIVGAVVGLIFELVCLKTGKIRIDDNLIIPIASSIAMYLVSLI